MGVLTAFLAIAPFTHRSEVSFVLDKNKVEVARERMRVTEALYRGEDSKGQPFSLRAGRSEEHTSELQSLMRISYAVFCLKKKKNQLHLHVAYARKIESQNTNQYINCRVSYINNSKHTKV